jgi:hypothetical protein
MSERHWKLSPSDFAFLWEECKRCFYLKVVHGFNRPHSPMPKIFTKIDLLMKDFFANKPVSEIIPELPSGVVMDGEGWVESTPILIKEHNCSLYLKGKFDTTLSFDDGTYGVIDFKTSESKSDHIALYSRQLHAYAYALENPAPGKLGLTPISRMGLLCVEPNKMVRTESERYSYEGKATWLECPKDMGSFMSFLVEVGGVLQRQEPPESNPTCQWCKYRDASRLTGY